jgi:hypothetical protein
VICEPQEKSGLGKKHPCLVLNCLVFVCIPLTNLGASQQLTKITSKTCCRVHSAPSDAKGGGVGKAMSWAIVMHDSWRCSTHHILTQGTVLHEHRGYLPSSCMAC